jgi:pyruvate formate lyase activating enzyme
VSKPKKPLLLRIKGNSLDDGPGIRTVVFFKGCPLACLWCHNPEGQTSEAELSYDQSICIGCGTCLEVCTNGVRNPERPGELNRGRCRLCFSCVESCPSGALTRQGKEATAEQIVSEVLRDKSFMETSGGGVTFSGGEATMHLELLVDVARQLKAQSIHTILETCGIFNRDRFLSDLLPYLDGIYFDLKLFDSEKHKQFCGRSNERILENFASLLELSRKGGFDLLPRIPLIPGITTTSENLGSWANFLGEHRVTEVALLEYNPTWIQKLAHLGRSDDLVMDEKLNQFMTPEETAACHRIFNDHGISTGRQTENLPMEPDEKF